ncbi:hypothetical protein MKW92_009807 [Papaver armeniacum]|nr:hypothetical protein MKW92_009807 [Papaver armeniacum]
MSDSSSSSVILSEKKLESISYDKALYKQDINKKEVKLWGGRFEESVTDTVEKFSESISYDKALYKQDIKQSKAHATMLAKQGLMTASDRDAILQGLDKIEKCIEGGEFVWRTDREDVHMNIEAALTDLIGEPAKKLHTARSRNDQVVTDLRLWCRDAIDKILLCIKRLQVALVNLAKVNEGLIVPGYTHLQRAQPVLLQHLLLSYVEQEDKEPLFDSVKTIIGMLEVSTEFAQNITFNRERIQRALPAGHLDATTVADYLLSGKSFRFIEEKNLIHLLLLCRIFHLGLICDIVGRSVALCVSKKCELQDLSLDELKSLSPIFEQDVYEYLGVENSVKKFRSYGSTGSECVRDQLGYWSNKLEIDR